MIDRLLQLAHLGEEGVVVGVRAREFLGDRIEPVDHRLGLGDAILHVLEDRPGLVKVGLLHEDADGVALVQHRLTIGDVVDAGHDLEEAGLTRTVRADNTDLRARQEGQGHVIEDDLVAVSLTCLAQGVNELSHGQGA